MTDPVQTEVQCPGRAQYAHRAEHRHQVGQQVLGDVKTLFGSFNEGLVDLHFAQRADQ
ncbi:hypothetical protein D3C81_2312350 [compost metagenome]